VNFNTFQEIRQQIYETFERGSDALFNLCDALLSEPQARSLPELSLSPFFEREWSSLYQALDHGLIEITRLQRVWSKALMQQRGDQHPVWISVDSTTIARPEADTSPDRGIIYVPNMPRARKPISVGWQISTVMLLPDEPSSWVGVLDQARVGTQQTAIQVGIEQLSRVVPLLHGPVIVLADRWYATAAFIQACSHLGCQVVIRLKSNRKLYRRAGPPTGKRGRPAIHGAHFQPKDAWTHAQVHQQWSGLSPSGKPVQVRAWNQMHFRDACDVEFSVVEVQRANAANSKRDPRQSWFILLDTALPLSQIVPLYERRFSHEHGYRYLKQDLLWTRIHVRTPQQFERWTWVVSTVMNLLVVARSLGQASYRRWERRTEVVTPRQVRRTMARILGQLGTPARRCQRRGKSPGRPTGFHPRTARRYPVIIKRTKRAKKAAT
jgi:hypothetical protein